MADRYFAAEPISSPRARLVEDEAHHLAHVMRARAGHEVTLFDGSGAEWQARVVRIGRNEVELDLIERREVDRELPLKLTMAVALPKGDRQRWLVEKAVELGVARLVPVITERGVAQPVEKALSRLRKAVVEASKQCGRNRLMDIATPLDYAELIADPSADNTIRAIADPGGSQPAGNLLAAADVSAAAELIWLIGPEGGFSERELDAARSQNWKVVRLGARIMRVETAVIYLAALSADACLRRGDQRR